MAGTGNDLVREARKRAGLTQRELADKAGTTQSAVARIETGASTPSFDAVLRYVRLCGLDLDLMLVQRDDSDWIQAERLVPLDAGERVARMQRVAKQLRAVRKAEADVRRETELGPILAVLARHGVRFVVIGGLAATSRGSPFATENVDVTPEAGPDNVGRLSAALTELGARTRTDAVDGGPPFGHDAESLAARVVWNLVTKHGELGISLVPSGTRGYPDLSADATQMTLVGVVVSVASLADVIRSKQAANRPKDQRVLPVLREILAHQRH